MNIYEMILIVVGVVEMIVAFAIVLKLNRLNGWEGKLERYAVDLEHWEVIQKSRGIALKNFIELADRMADAAMESGEPHLRNKLDEFKNMEGLYDVKKTGE